MRFGMDETLGPVAWDTEQGKFLQTSRACSGSSGGISDQTAHEIDLAVRSHLEAALERAVEILRDNRAALDEGAAALLAHETLTGRSCRR